MSERALFSTFSFLLAMELAVGGRPIDGEKLLEAAYFGEVDRLAAMVEAADGGAAFEHDTNLRKLVVLNALPGGKLEIIKWTIGHGFPESPRELAEMFESGHMTPFWAQVFVDTLPAFRSGMAKWR